MLKKDTYKINKSYDKNKIINIVSNFNKSGKLVFGGERNIIKKFIIENNNFIDNKKAINIKKFKKKSFLIEFFYKYFKDSKAKRSYDYAKKLLKFGIDTPEPIAYFDNFFMKDENMSRSFYISENIDYDFTCREVFWDDPKSKDIEEIIKKDFNEIVKGFAEFTYKLHKNGVKFDDYSPGNVLIKKVLKCESETKNNYYGYKFYLIDLNRMSFFNNMSFDMRIKNVSRMMQKKIYVERFSKEYAKFYKEKSEQEIFEKLYHYTEKHRKSVELNDIRRNIKKMFKKKK